MNKTIDVSEGNFKIEFQVNDEVEWFDFEGAFVKNYSKIYRMTPKYAILWDDYKGHFVRILKTKLNWS